MQTYQNTTLTLTRKHSPTYADSDITFLADGSVCVETQYSIPSSYFYLIWHGLRSAHIPATENLAAVTVGTVMESRCESVPVGSIISVFGTELSTVIVVDGSKCNVLDDYPLPVTFMQGYMLSCIEYAKNIMAIQDNTSLLVVGRTPLADLCVASILHVLDIDCDQFTGGSAKFHPDVFGFYDGIIDCRYAPVYDSCRCCLNSTGFYYPVNFGEQPEVGATEATPYGHRVLSSVPCYDILETAAEIEYDALFNIPTHYCNFRNIFPAVSTGLFCSIHSQGV